MEMSFLKTIEVKDKLQYGTTTITYSLEYMNRKTLGIKVYPDKSVQVLAPHNTTSEEAKKKVKTKAAWILKQQDFFLSFHPLTPERKYVSGETHLYLGKQYVLKLIESTNQNVKLHAGRLEVFVNDKENKTEVELLLKKWYKSKAVKHFQELYENNLNLTISFNKKPTSLKYRWMSKRWGSCDKNGGIHLNLELIKAPRKCIEYVLIHEFCHLAHHDHSKAFYELLEKLYPKWKEIKNKLEKLMV
jgi:predicted metal-dependent hydrolase